MAVRIAALNVRVLFQKSEVVVDGIGNHRSEWVDYYGCFAKVSDSKRKRSAEKAVAGIVADHGDICFEVRFCQKVSEVSCTGFRIVWQGQAYDIVRIDYLDLEKKVLKFSCEKVRR